MEILEEKSTQMRLELPPEINDALLAYKRSLKRLTGRNVNKDELILSILKSRIPTLKEKVRRMDADYANRFIKK
jgi:hypothetical protein